MGIKHEILKLFNTRAAYYKGIPVNIFGLPVFKDKSRKSVQNAWYALKNDGCLAVENERFLVTKKGRAYLKEQVLSEHIFSSPFPKDSPKNLLVIYDIPEEKKPEREWFRRHLRKFGYTMIQRSAWIGPSPLPEEFLSYVKKIGLKSTLKTFKLIRPYLISDRA